MAGPPDGHHLKPPEVQQGAAWHRKGMAPLVGPLAASFGDPWRLLGACLVSSVFSILSPLFSLLLVVVVLGGLEALSSFFSLASD